jgi:uncharacterized protein
MSRTHPRMRNLIMVVLTPLAIAGALMPHAVAQSSATTTASIDRPKGIAIGTGGPLGVYFVVGNALCRIAQRDNAVRLDSPDPTLGCAAASTGGSAPNVELLRSGVMEFGIIQSDVMFHAARGSGRFAGKKMEKLRSIFSLHAEPFQFLVARGLGIAGIADLKSRKVNIGPQDSAQNAIMNELFAIHKLEAKSFAQITQLAPAEQFQGFCTGDIEAIGMLIGFPNGAYASAMKNCGGELVDVMSEPVQALLAGTPYYASTTIPQSAYPTMDRATVTFGVLAVVGTTSDVPTDTVYRFVRAIFERLEDLKAMHPALAELEPRRMINDGITVPLHAGAEKYYRERGWLRTGGPR